MNNQKGFTLIEVMITAAVVVFVLVGFMGTNSAMQQATDSSFERTLALQDANQVIERIRTAAATGTFPANAVTAFPDNGTVAGFTSLTGETVTVTYGNATANPLDVRIQIQWLENGRRAVRAHLRTLVTQRI